MDSLQKAREARAKNLALKKQEKADSASVVKVAAPKMAAPQPVAKDTQHHP